MRRSGLLARLRYPRHMAKKLLIGMLHLPALPGAPNHHRELAEVESRLVEEACLLSEVGFHGLSRGDGKFR